MTFCFWSAKLPYGFRSRTGIPEKPLHSCQCGSRATMSQRCVRFSIFPIKPFIFPMWLLIQVLDRQSCFLQFWGKILSVISKILESCGKIGHRLQQRPTRGRAYNLLLGVFLELGWASEPACVLLHWKLKAYKHLAAWIHLNHFLTQIFCHSFCFNPWGFFYFTNYTTLNLCY